MRKAEVYEEKFFEILINSARIVIIQQRAAIRAACCLYTLRMARRLTL